MKQEDSSHSTSQRTEKKLVVLLHGLLRTRFSMSFLGLHLRREGYEVLNYGYWTMRYSIKEQARRLEAFLAQKVPPGREINFVTHSLGSIILRKLLLDYPGRFNCGRAVMLGPPNQGSCYAAFLQKRFKLGRVLGPAFLELCNLKMNGHCGRPEIGVIAGGTKSGRGIVPVFDKNNDGIVTVEEARLEGASDFIVLTGLHSILVYFPEVIRQTIHFLNEGKFDR